MPDRLDNLVGSVAPELSELEKRRARLRAAMDGPGVVKSLSQRGALGKLRAAAAFARALAALHWSLSDAADHFGVDKKAIDAFLKGGAQPAWYIHELPRNGFLAYQEAMLEDVPPPSERKRACG